MGFILFSIGMVFGVVFIINNIVRTARRENTIRLIELVWSFMATLIPVSALLVDNQAQARFDRLEQIVFLLILPLLISGAGLFFVEAFRPQRWRQSRGVLSIGMAFLLIFANLTFSFFGRFSEINAQAVTARPTPVNNSPSAQSPCEVAGLELVTTLFTYIQDATGLDQDALLDVATGEGQVSVAQLVTDNGGDPQVLIDQIVNYTEPAIQNLRANDCIPVVQATLFISQLETIAAFIVNNDLNTLQQFAGGNGEPDETQDLTSEELQATRIALVEEIQQIEPTATPTITLTPTLTATPTPTRTPAPTQSPTPTRERYASPTPTITPTLPNPCLATTLYNVNMRDYPSLEDSQVLQTIPFDTVVTIYAPNDDHTWWFGQYEEIAGWISAEFINVTNPCLTLPPRQPERR